MIVCFEGPDGVGKTSLIRDIKEALTGKVEVVHQVFPTYDFTYKYLTDKAYGYANFADMWDTYGAMVSKWNDPDTLVLLDRFYPSTAVYNFNGRLPVDEWDLPPVDLFVHVTCPYDLYPKSKGELTKEEFERKVIMYRDFFKKTSVPTMTYNTSKDDITCILQALSPGTLK